MNNKLHLFALIIVATAISGCAGMSSDECLATDWSAIGYEDGSRGYTSDNFGKHRKACAKHGVTADFGDYKDGRAEGLNEYCQPGRGFSVGVNGGRYYGVCSVESEGDFSIFSPPSPAPSDCDCDSVRRFASLHTMPACLRKFVHTRAGRHRQSIYDQPYKRKPYGYASSRHTRDPDER